MSAKTEPKDIYRLIIEAISHDDPYALERFISPDVVDHNPVPGQAAGLDGFKQWMASARTSFPDLQGSVEDVIVQGERVAARMTWHGTHRGDFVGVPPTNKRIAMTAFHHVRFARGRAAEWWGTADVFGALQQMSATIASPKA
jgi:steroid delta-isomerase-like uncharacterized protein